MNTIEMVRAAYPELYEEEQRTGSIWCAYDYNPLIQQIGSILIQVDDNDYQGDTRVLFEKEGRYGFLIFGWGSCSGCDALQACNSTQEIAQLLETLINDVEWFNSLDQLKERFTTKDWELDYSWHAEETKEFIEKVLNYER